MVEGRAQVGVVGDAQTFHQVRQSPAVDEGRVANLDVGAQKKKLFSSKNF